MDDLLGLFVVGVAIGGSILFCVVVYTHLAVDKAVERKLRKLRNIGFTFVNPDHPLLAEPVKKPVFRREDIDFIYESTKNL